MRSRGRAPYGIIQVGLGKSKSPGKKPAGIPLPRRKDAIADKGKIADHMFGSGRVEDFTDHDPDLANPAKELPSAPLPIMEERPVPEVRPDGNESHPLILPKESGATPVLKARVVS